MTKKDFILIAKIIKDTEYRWTALTSQNTTKKIRSRIATIFADELRATNPRFDQERFLTACGVEILETLT